MTAPPPMSKWFVTKNPPPEYLTPFAYTTGQVAKICQVAPRTVSKWVDGGLMRGYRVPGDGKDRRVSEPDLIAFMTAHEIPLPPALRPWVVVAYGVTIATPDPDLVVAGDSFEFGRRVAFSRVRLALIGDECGREIALSACKVVRDRWPAAAVLLVLSEDAGDVVALPGVVVLRKPLDWSAVAEHLGAGAGVSK